MTSKRQRFLDRQTRWLLNLNPALAAIFYVGFVTVAIFIALVYSRSLTDDVRAQAHQTDQKIIAAQVAACRRGNGVRRSFNQRVDVFDELARAALREGGLPRDLRIAYAQILRLPRVPIVDCKSLAVGIGQVLRRQKHGS